MAVKKRGISMEDMRRTVPPMPESFEKRMNGLLSRLPEQKEEIVMKKKLSIGLIFAIVLILLAVTALAVGISRGFFEQVGRIQARSGAYMDWTFNEKLEFLSLMEEYGVSVDSKILGAARDNKVDAKAREEALDSYMAERYGIDGRIDVITLESILFVEMGGYPDTWSLEDKAWYTSLQRELGFLSSEEERIYSLPTDEELSKDEAETVARDYLKTLSETIWAEQADSAKATCYTLVHACDETVNTWEITFQSDEGDSIRVDLPAPKGTTAAQASVCGHYLLCDEAPFEESEERKRYLALTEAYGNAAMWPLEALNEYMPETYLLPGEGDIAPEKAKEIALDALKAAYPADAERISSRPANLSLYLTALGGENTRSYCLSVYEDDVNYIISHYVYLRADNGEILKTDKYEE